MVGPKVREMANMQPAPKCTATVRATDQWPYGRIVTVPPIVYDRPHVNLGSNPKTLITLWVCCPP